MVFCWGASVSGQLFWDICGRLPHSGAISGTIGGAILRVPAEIRVSTRVSLYKEEHYGNLDRGKTYLICVNRTDFF